MATTNKLFTLGAGNSGNLTLSASSASVDFSTSRPASEPTIRLLPSVDCTVRVTVGTSTAVATDLQLKAGIEYKFAIAPDSTHLSALAGGAGTLNWAVDKGA